MGKLLFIFLMIPISCFSQSDSTEFQFVKIDSVNYSKDELFLKAETWLANSFVSSKSVIQMKDKDAGKIICKGVFAYVDKEVGSTTHFDIKFSLEISVRDKKYRIKLYDFINSGYIDWDGSDLTTSTIKGSGLSFNDSTLSALPYVKDDLIPRINESARKMIYSFNTEMNKKPDDF